MGSHDQRATAPEAAVAERPHGGRNPLTWAWLALLTLAVIGLGIVVAIGLLGGEEPPPNAASSGPAGSGGRAARRVVPGPWGELEITRIVLAAPPENVLRLAEDASSRPADDQAKWWVPAAGATELVQWLVDVGLSAELRERLAALAAPDPSGDGLTIRPPRELVLGLAPEDREKLYVALCEYARNSDQREALRFYGDRPERWLAEVEISPASRRVVEPLVYRHGGFMYFSDYRVVRPLLASPAERQNLLVGLSRDATCLARLHVSEGADVEPLAAYWGNGGRKHRVRPLLESLAAVPGGGKIQVALLLPAPARETLYTYPRPGNGTSDRACLRTALSFFRGGEEKLPADEAALPLILQHEYDPVGGELQLGDVAVVADEQARLVRAGVYIAAGLYFTRNAASPSGPWTLVGLDQLRDYYPGRGPRQVTHYRWRRL